MKRRGGVKPGIYNIYTANPVDKTKEHSGIILYADKMTIYQQVGKGQYINHERADFAKLPVTGETKPISYSAEGNAVVSEAALVQKQTRKM